MKQSKAREGLLEVGKETENYRDVQADVMRGLVDGLPEESKQALGRMLESVGGRPDVKGRSSKMNGRVAKPAGWEPPELNVVEILAEPKPKRSPPIAPPLQAAEPIKKPKKSKPEVEDFIGVYVKPKVKSKPKPKPRHSGDYLDTQKVKVVKIPAHRKGSSIGIVFAMLQRSKTIGDFRKQRIKAGMGSDLGGFLKSFVRKGVVIIN